MTQHLMVALVFLQLLVLLLLLQVLHLQLQVHQRMLLWDSF